MSFTTAINCIDGRIQEPVIHYMKTKYKCPFVDMITEPGPVKILSDATNLTLIQSIKNRVEISINHHQSKIIAIIAHEDCAGNPVPKETQLVQLQPAKKTVQSWNYNVEIITLWVALNGKIEIINTK
jgi:hypothetical protein